MKKLILILALGAALGVGLAVVVAVVWNAARASQGVVQQPPPPQEAAPAPAAPPRRVSLPVFLALACTCNLSVVALLGSVALRRRMDSLSPDKGAPKQ